MVCAARGIPLRAHHARHHERRAAAAAAGLRGRADPDPRAPRACPARSRRAEELAKTDPRYFIPQQFENPANPEIHRRTTAEEIWRDTDGQVDIVVSRHRHRRHHHRRRAGAQGAQALGADASPSSRPPRRCCRAARRARTPFRASARASYPTILDTPIYDEIIRVKNEDAIDTGSPFGRREEGLLVGHLLGRRAVGRR